MTINFPTGTLFVDPRTNQRIAGAQLSFFVSLGGAIAPVYQDAALTTPWAQPIVADANGNFPPNIYFDAFNTIQAKIQLANSVGAIQWTVTPYSIPLIVTQDSFNIQYDSVTIPGQIIGNVRIRNPTTAVPALTVNNSGLAIRLVGALQNPLNSVVTGPIWRIGNGTTGAQTASFAPVANKPGPANSTPTKWLPIVFNGTTYYAPCFL